MTNDEIKTIVTSDVSKSEKIRKLYFTNLETKERTGLSQYKISKLLEIIPQFVNNVVIKELSKTQK